MSVGEALAQARNRAGLTVEEVSERSLIRASVIASMESDDYDACGGPIYVNGYIRAIATAIGTDPVPLIRSYAESTRPNAVPDAGQGVPGPDHVTEPDPPADQDSAAPWLAADDLADTRVDLMLPLVDEQPPAREQPVAEQQPAGEQPAGEQPAAEQPGGPEQPAGEQQPAGPEQPEAAEQPASSPGPSAESGPSASPAAPAETGPNARPVPPAGARPFAWPVEPAKATAPQPIAHAEPAAPAQARPKPRPAYSQPAAPAEPGENEPPLRSGPAVAASARPAMRQQAPPSRTKQQRPPRTRERRRARWAAGLAVLLLVLLGFAGREIFASVHHGHPQDAAAANPVSTHSSAAPSPVPSATSAAPSPTPSPSASQPSVQSLSPVNAVAFGPSGTSDGDNPSIADRALTRAESGWQSSWYVTPAFGALKQGTGLLVDMGTVVSMTSVAIQLGQLPGATIELGVGDEPVMGAMHMVQRVTGAGGRVVLPLTAVKARYFLIWFTLLPPDGAGHYQATIDGIAVQGYR